MVGGEDIGLNDPIKGIKYAYREKVRALSRKAAFNAVQIRCIRWSPRPRIITLGRVFDFDDFSAVTPSLD